MSPVPALPVILPHSRCIQVVLDRCQGEQSPPGVPVVPGVSWNVTCPCPDPQAPGELQVSSCIWDLPPHPTCASQGPLTCLLIPPVLPKEPAPASSHLCFPRNLHLPHPTCASQGTCTCLIPPVLPKEPAPASSPHLCFPRNLHLPHPTCASQGPLTCLIPPVLPKDPPLPPHPTCASQGPSPASSSHLCFPRNLHLPHPTCASQGTCTCLLTPLCFPRNLHLPPHPPCASQGTCTCLIPPVLPKDPSPASSPHLCFPRTPHLPPHPTCASQGPPPAIPAPGIRPRSPVGAPRCPSGCAIPGNPLLEHLEFLGAPPPRE
ncbi:uncharacterized protein LOC135404234 [Pseudopipra pipra]|uniref:uncharacterized protein LOC135404234 n=1 Tax=Pseudopipra pipra TaxID=415032 RepID=UPI00313A043E